MNEEIKQYLESFDDLTKQRFHSVYDLLLESTARQIEANTASVMARTMILPACIRYQVDVANAVAAAKQVGVASDELEDLLAELVQTIAAFRKGIQHLDGIIAKKPAAKGLTGAAYQRDKVLPAMEALRALGDKLEGMIADEYWPLPTYREMLFIR